MKRIQEHKVLTKLALTMLILFALVLFMGLAKADDRPQDSSVYGKVVDQKTEDGLEESRVRLFNEDRDYETFTDSEGNYEMICSSGSYTIRVTKDSYRVHREEVSVPGRTARRYDVDMNPECTSLEGNVTREDTGDPVENARVKLQGKEVYELETNEDGHYYLECEPGDYTLLIIHEEYRRHEEKLSLKENSRNICDVPLSLKTYLEGSIIDTNSGEGIEGVSLGFREGDWNTTTDRNGAYRLDCQDGLYTLEVSCDHYRAFSRELDLQPGANEFNSELSPVVNLEGQVTDSGTGEPLKDADIHLEGEGDFWTTSDPGGNYSLECDPGNYTFTVGHEDYKEYREMDLTLKKGSYQRSVELTFIPCSLLGQLTNRVTGEPVAKALVEFLETDLWGLSDPEGNYHLEGRCGEYELLISHEEYEDYRVVGLEIEQGENTLNVALSPVRSYLEGRLQDAVTGEALEGLQLRLVGRDHLVTMSDSKGNYALECEPGNYTLELDAQGYLKFSLEMNLVSGENRQDVELLPEPALLQGRVLDRRTGEPLEGVSIELLSVGEVYTNWSLPGGSYQLQCPAGDYALRVSHQGYTSFEDLLTLGRGTRRLDLELDDLLCRLEGNVTQAFGSGEGHALSGALVEFVGPEDRDVQTDGAGYFYLELEAGDYSVFVTHPECQPFQGRLDLEPGEENFDVSLEYIFPPLFGVDLEVETNIHMKAGEEVFVPLVVKNTGDLDSVFFFRLQEESHSPVQIALDREERSIRAGSSKVIGITVCVGEGAPKGDYVFTVVVTQEPQGPVSKELTLTIHVEEAPKAGSRGELPGFSLVSLVAASFIFFTFKGRCRLRVRRLL